MKKKVVQIAITRFLWDSTTTMLNIKTIPCRIEGRNYHVHREGYGIES